MTKDNGQNMILVVNCGSSSLKCAVLAGKTYDLVLSGLAECLGTAEARLKFTIKKGSESDKTSTLALSDTGHNGAVMALLDVLKEHDLFDQIEAVGHRVVHGGEKFRASALITPEVLREIEACTPLAPLHNPANLSGIHGAKKFFPDVPHVAVFDTAFHQTMPESAFLYAIPEQFYQKYGVRRYGFHGTSHRFVAERTVDLLGLNPKDHGLIVAHLGNGASATAIVNGRSVDTTMGMTPLEGLVMGTRAGDIDVGAVLHMARSESLDLDGIDRVLNRESGLLGLSGFSNDCRDLEKAAGEGHEGAKRALTVFVHRLARLIGGLAISLTRLDALVFTGGIGENSVFIRRAAVAHLGILGVTLDLAANERAVRGYEGVISRDRAPAVAVVPTNEEWMIAYDTRNVAHASIGRA